MILRWSTKNAEFWLGVQFPLKKIYKAIDINMIKFLKGGFALCLLKARRELRDKFSQISQVVTCMQVLY